LGTGKLGVNLKMQAKDKEFVKKAFGKVLGDGCVDLDWGRGQVKI